MRPALLLSLLLAMFAGCADQAAPGEAAIVDAESSAPTHVVAFGLPAESASTTVTGTFGFEENQQFIGDIEAELGMEDNIHYHSFSDLLPADGLYHLRIVADAQPGGGDIDVWLQSAPTLLNSFCECSFGGHNEIFASGFGAGELVVAIQYDEVSSGPSDPNIAFTGFDYSIDVSVTTAPDGLPAGVPIGIRLGAGQAMMLRNHTVPVTIYGPDDNVLLVLEQDGRFEAVAGGEHIIVQQIDGSPFGIEVHGDPASARFLDVATIFEEIETDPDGGSATFDVPIGVLEVGACGIADFIGVDPDFQIIDPAGETWGSAGASGPQLGGWGSCMSNWFGAPGLLAGSWNIELTTSFAPAGRLIHWHSVYVR